MAVAEAPRQQAQLPVLVTGERVYTVLRSKQNTINAESCARPRLSCVYSSSVSKKPYSYEYSRTDESDRPGLYSNSFIGTFVFLTPPSVDVPGASLMSFYRKYGCNGFIRCTL